MQNNTELAIILSIISAIGALGAGFFAARQSRRATERSAESRSDVAVYKTKIDTETKRFDQLFDAQGKLIENLQGRNDFLIKEQDKLYEAQRAIRTERDNCQKDIVELKIKFTEQTARLNSLEKQLQTVTDYYKNAGVERRKSIGE